MRCLRFIYYIDELKFVIMALIQALRGIFNISIIILLFWLIYAIIGVYLFENKLKYCSSSYPDSIYNLEGCEELNGEVLVHPLNCDSLYQAYKLLFVTSTLDGWPKYMYWFIDGDSKHPSKYKNLYLSTYFISFIIFSGFFMMNLFVSIVALYFTKVKEQMIQTKQLKQTAKNWAYFQNIIKSY